MDGRARLTSTIGIENATQRLGPESVESIFEDEFEPLGLLDSVLSLELDDVDIEPFVRGCISAPHATEETAAVAVFMRPDVFRAVNSALCTRDAPRMKMARSLLLKLLRGIRSLQRVDVPRAFIPVASKVEARVGDLFVLHGIRSATSSREVAFQVLQDGGTVLEISGNVQAYDASAVSCQSGEILIELERECTVVSIGTAVELRMVDSPLLLERLAPQTGALPVHPPPPAGRFDAEIAMGVDGARPIVDVLKSSLDSSATVIECLNALVNLAAKDQEKKEELKVPVGREAVPTIVAALKRHVKGDTATISLALFSLWFFATIDEHKVTTLQEGGLPLIIEALKRFPENESICVNGCGALMNLSAAKEEHRIAIARAGAIPLIVSILRRFNEPWTAMRASGALWNLTLSSEIRPAVYREGAIPLLTGALRWSMANGELCTNVCACLWNLSCMPEGKADIGRKGGIQLLLEVLTRHENDPNVCDKALGCMWNSVENKDNQATFLREGGLNKALEIFKKHSSHSGVCTRSCGLIRCLTAGKPTKTLNLRIEVCHQGFGPLIVACMRTFSQDTSVCEQGLAAIWNVCTGTKETQTEMEHEGAIQLIVSALDTHAGNAIICEQGCGATWSIVCNHNANKLAAFHAGVLDLLFASIKRHAGEKRVIEMAVGALGALASQPEVKTAIVRKINEDRDTFEQYKRQILGFFGSLFS